MYYTVISLSHHVSVVMCFVHIIIITIYKYIFIITNLVDHYYYRSVGLYALQPVVTTGCTTGCTKRFEYSYNK